MESNTDRTITLLEVRPGAVPFEEWYRGLIDKRVRLKVITAITRLADPNYRNTKSLGQGVYELRIFYGAGYRIYFAQKGRTLVILLGGGDKTSQQKDIYEAQKIWGKFKNENNSNLRKFSH